MSDANQVTQAAALASIHQLRVGYLTIQPAQVTAGGCILHLKSLTEMRYSKMKITGSGQRMEYYIHHLVTRGKGELIDRALQVSHLCHKKRCINPAHITQESAAVNISRLPCQQLGLIAFKCPCCDTVSQVNPCKHVPQCFF